MDYLSLFVMWVIICLLLWFFNKKYRNYFYEEMILYIVLDSILVFFLLYLTTLNGYITGILPFVGFILGSMAIIYFRIRDDDDFDVELTLEMAKNTFIKFNLIVLPFMISLSIFRFMPFYFQIFCSALVVVVIQFLSFFLQKITILIVDSVKSDPSEHNKYIAIWLIILGVSALVIVFDFPTYKVEKSLNLQHHTPIYGIYDGYDTQLDSSYDLELVDEYEDSQYNYPAPPVEEELPTKLYLGLPISHIYYDTEKDVTYETYYENLYRTYIIKLDSNNNEEIYMIKGLRTLMVVDDVFYLVGKDSDVIEMVDENLNTTSILNIPVHDVFFNNQMASAEFFYSIKDDKLLLTTVEMTKMSAAMYGISAEKTYFHKEYIIIQDDIDITLPFYSHFGLFHIVSLFVIMFIPISNYKSFITVIDFNSRFKKK